MRRQVIGLAVLTLALAAPAWGDDKSAPEDEKLYGTWDIVSTEYMEKSIPIPADQKQTFAFAKGGKVIIKGPGKTVEESSYKLGPTKTPREIDITSSATEGPKAGTIKAIYQVEGDTLKIAVSLKGLQGDRPTSFDSKASAIMILKRQKP